MAKNKKYPFILAHGLARPDHLIDSIFNSLSLSIYDLSFVSDRFHYFKGIASFLKKHGIEVYHSRVSFAADVDTRAEDLKNEVIRILDKNGQKKAHIIAHSMGGLDARHMIVKEKMEDKVASLTTISTPHHGTSAADWALGQGIDKIIGAIRRFLNLEGIKSVTPES
jgi:triacylglycerol esterase/lipase EstA (alpha/beta hydrolase family)